MMIDDPLLMTDVGSNWRWMRLAVNIDLEIIRMHHSILVEAGRIKDDATNLCR